MLVFAENLRRYNRSRPIVQILTFMRVAEILGEALAHVLLVINIQFNKLMKIEDLLF